MKVSDPRKFCKLVSEGECPLGHKSCHTECPQFSSSAIDSAGWNKPRRTRIRRDHYYFRRLEEARREW